VVGVAAAAAAVIVVVRFEAGVVLVEVDVEFNGEVESVFDGGWIVVLAVEESNDQLYSIEVGRTTAACTPS
jgi:hypothetical protein